MEDTRTLGLQVLLHALEVDVAQTARDQDREEPGRVSGDVVLLAQQLEDGLGAEPENGDGDVKESQDEERSLQDDAKVMLVLAAGEAGGGEGVDCSGSAEGYQPGGSHGKHVGEGSSGQSLGRQPAHNQDGDGLQRVLQGVGKDDGNGALEENPQLGQDELGGAAVSVLEIEDVALFALARRQQRSALAHGSGGIVIALPVPAHEAGEP